MSKYVKDWNPKRVKAMVAGNVAKAMTDDVGPFLVQEARARVRRRTGKLSDAIDFIVTVWGDKIEGVLGVRTGAKGGHGFLGWLHEMGTSKMAAHPFLRPAVFDNAAEIVRRLGGK